MTIGQKELEVLRAIQNIHAPTRNALAEECHISTVLVSAILKDLEKSSYIEKRDEKKPTGGRPSTVYRLSPALECYAGIAIKADRIVATLVDAAGGLLSRNDRILTLSPDPEEHVENVLEQVCNELSRVKQAQRRLGPDIKTVGITVPGMVNTASGIWLHGLQVTGIERVDARTLIQDRIGIPCVIEDWSRSVAFLEQRRAGAAAPKHFVLLYLGVGVGSGIIADGTLYRGRNGLAGEVGHLVVEKDGTRCTCGSIGCLETVASTSGLLRRFRDRLNEGVLSVLQQHQANGYECLDIGAVRRAAAEGDRLTMRTLNEVAELLGEGCTKILKLLDPEKILVSGPVSTLTEYLKPTMLRVVRERVLPDPLPDSVIEAAEYTEDDEALGAAFLARDYSWNNAGVLASRLSKPNAP